MVDALVNQPKPSADGCCCIAGRGHSVLFLMAQGSQVADERPSREYSASASRSISIPEPGLSGIGSMPSRSSCQPPAAISSMNGDPVRYSTRSVSAKCRGDLQIGSQTHRRVPAMRNETDAVFARHPGDPPLLAQSAHLGHIRLHDIERAALPAMAESSGGASAPRLRRSAPWPRGARRRNPRAHPDRSGSSNQVTS